MTSDLQMGAFPHYSFLYILDTFPCQRPISVETPFLILRRSDVTSELSTAQRVVVEIRRILGPVQRVIYTDMMLVGLIYQYDYTS
jgi:hypothetical protein